MRDYMGEMQRQHQGRSALIPHYTDIPHQLASQDWQGQLIDEYARQQDSMGWLDRLGGMSTAAMKGLVSPFSPYTFEESYNEGMDAMYGIDEPGRNYWQEVNETPLAMDPMREGADPSALYAASPIGQSQKLLNYLKVGDINPFYDLPKQGDAIDKDIGGGNYLSAAGRAALVGVDWLGPGVFAKQGRHLGAKAITGTKNAIDKAAAALPTPAGQRIFDDLSMAGAMSAAPGRGMTSTVIGSRGKNFPQGDMVDLRHILDRDYPNMSESNKLDVTGIGMHPGGPSHGLTKTLPDTDLALTKLPTPSKADDAAYKANHKVMQAWDAVRAKDPLGDFKKLINENPELWKRKGAAEKGVFDYDMKFKNNSIGGKVGEHTLGSQAILNYPSIKDMSIDRAPRGAPVGHVRGNELMISGEHLPVMGHELGHAVSDRQGWPRGGNTGEMRDLHMDMEYEANLLEKQIPLFEEDRISALAANNLGEADKQARIMMDKVDRLKEIKENLNISPFDRYQSLLDERIQRYTQHGIDQGLSADDLAMFRLPDFMSGEKMRTGLDSLALPPNSRPKVSDVLGQQGDIGSRNQKFRKKYKNRHNRKGTL